MHSVPVTRYWHRWGQGTVPCSVDKLLTVLGRQIICQQYAGRACGLHHRHRLRRGPERHTLQTWTLLLLSSIAALHQVNHAF